VKGSEVPFRRNIHVANYAHLGGCAHNLKRNSVQTEWPEMTGSLDKLIQILAVVTLANVLHKSVVPLCEQEHRTIFIDIFHENLPRLQNLSRVGQNIFKVVVKEALLINRMPAFRASQLFCSAKNPGSRASGRRRVQP
jgi:hypothetical protein